MNYYKQAYKKSESYLEKFRREADLSFLNTHPLTKIEWFPRSGNEGLYGFTYRHSGKIGLREDLNPKEKLDTDIHESIHTPDEYYSLLGRKQ